MRVLLMHSIDTWYKAVRPAIKDPPDPPKEEELGKAVVAFISVESEDGEEEVKDAIQEIIQHAKRVGLNKILIYPFAHLSPDLAEPEKAHKILVELEEKLSKAKDFEVHRAPFGWYKSFRVVCAGHPMCELSRSFKRKEKEKFLFYVNKDGNKLSLKEAIDKNLVPKGIIQSRIWEQKTVEILERFGLYPDLRDSGAIMLEELEKWALETLGGGSFRLVKGQFLPTSLDKPFFKLYVIIKATLDVARYNPNSINIIKIEDPGEDIILSTKVYREDLFKSLNDLDKNLFENLLTINIGREGLDIKYDVDFNGELIFYRTRSGSLVPLAGKVSVRGFDGVFLGPMINILRALIDNGIRLAEKGLTPSLPYWLAPYQVALLPVKEDDLGYAVNIKNLIEDIARVYVDPPTRSLGARVRLAARYWTPYIVIIGKREVETRTVTIRKRGSREQETLTLEAFIDELTLLRRKSPRITITPLVS